MLELGTDELTLVLQLAPQFKAQITPYEWSSSARDMIYRFVEKSDFKTVFGAESPEARPPQGYTHASTYGEHSFYLAVAHHEYQVNMGVAVRFSAQALDYYCESTGLKVFQFLQRIQDILYTVRLSRIDLTADYIDEGIVVTDIYQHLMDNKIAVFREYESKKTGAPAYRRTDMQYQGFIKGREVPTVYLGSPQSNSRLRIYDKRREQIERNGTKLDKAKQSCDWVRFEGVFRHEFAHQIGDALLSVSNDDDYANLIACTMAQKFRFMYIENGVVDCDTEYTQKLLDAISSQSFGLKSPVSRNFEIAKSLLYLLNSSGFISTLYKIKAIWGEDAVSALMTFFMEFLDEWEPNADCRYWLRKNSADYIRNYPDFDSFMKDNVSTML